jgi:hypothetical protein
MQLVEYQEGAGDAGGGRKQSYFVELWDVGGLTGHSRFDRGTYLLRTSSTASTLPPLQHKQAWTVDMSH